MILFPFNKALNQPCVFLFSLFKLFYSLAKIINKLTSTVKAQNQLIIKKFDEKSKILTLFSRSPSDGL